MCMITVAPEPVTSVCLPKKRVSFRESHEVFAVEKVDASLIQDLYYNREDFRRFRGEKCQVPPPQRRQLRTKTSGVRRQKFQKLAAQRTAALQQTNARLLRGGVESLQGVRRHLRNDQ